MKNIATLMSGINIESFIIPNLQNNISIINEEEETYTNSDTSSEELYTAPSKKFNKYVDSDREIDEYKYSSDSDILDETFDEQTKNIETSNNVENLD